jgi:hypothetical protein
LLISIRRRSVAREGNYITFFPGEKKTMLFFPLGKGEEGSFFFPLKRNGLNYLSPRKKRAKLL